MGERMKVIQLAALVCAVLGLSACVTATPPIGHNFRASQQTARVVIMDPDVEVVFVTTGGAGDAGRLVATG